MLNIFRNYELNTRLQNASFRTFPGSSLFRKSECMKPIVENTLSSAAGLGVIQSNEVANAAGCLSMFPKIDHSFKKLAIFVIEANSKLFLIMSLSHPTKFKKLVSNSGLVSVTHSTAGFISAGGTRLPANFGNNPICRN